MGILDGLFGQQQAQVPGQQTSGLQNFLAPENAMPIAAALLGNQGNSQNFANAFGAYGQTAAQRAKTNKTTEFFRKNAPEFAQMIESGMDPKQAYDIYLKQRYAQTADPYKVVGGQIFDTRDKSFTAPPDTGGGTPETGLQPQMMRDPETGQTIYVQPTKDGRLVKSQVPEGFVPYDPYSKSYQSNLGKSQAGNAATLPTDIQNASQTVQQIDALIANPGLDSIVGPVDQLRGPLTLGGEGRDALARYNQLKGKAFLSAYSILKGGGQITEVEGAKAQDAMARMDRAQDEATFRAALQDFRDAVAEGIPKLLQKAGIPQDQWGQYLGGQATPAAPVAPQSGNKTQSGVSWSVEP